MGNKRDPRGRPSLYNPTQIGVRVSESDRRWLLAQAILRHTTVSAIVREAIAHVRQG